MKRIITYLLPVLFLTLVYSCYQKDDNYDYKAKTELSVSGIKDLYEKEALVEKLHIEPNVVVSNANDELSYEWSLFGYYRDAAHLPEKIAVKVIGTERILDYSIVEKPQSYSVILKVTNNTTGQIASVETRLNVFNKFSRGFYVLKEINGASDMDLFLPSGNIVPDLLLNKNGTRIEGIPQSLSVLPKYAYIDPNTATTVATTSLNVATDKRFDILDIADLGVIYDHNTMFYSGSGPIEAPLFSTFIYYGCAYYSDKGIYFSSYDLVWGGGGSGRFPLAATLENGCKPNKNIVSDRYYTFLFDELNGRFLQVNYNGDVQPFTDENKSGVIPTLIPNKIPHSLLYFGRNKIGKNDVTGFALMQDAHNSANLLLYELALSENLTNPMLSMKTLTGRALNRASCYAINELLARALYFVTDNKPYIYLVDDDREQPMTLQGLDASETIVFMRNRYWQQSTSDDKFNYLTVATVKGDTYKIYLYELLGATPTNAPVKILTGKGKPVSLQFVTPDFTADNAANYSTSY